MNNEKSKLIYYLLYLIGVLVVTLWTYTVVSQSTAINKVDIELKDHKTKQIATELVDIQWKTSIDGRLANIEGALGIDGFKKTR